MAGNIDADDSLPGFPATRTAADQELDLPASGSTQRGGAKEAELAGNDSQNQELTEESSSDQGGHDPSGTTQNETQEKPNEGLSATESAACDGDTTADIIQNSLDSSAADGTIDAESTSTSATEDPAAREAPPVTESSIAATPVEGDSHMDVAADRNDDSSVTAGEVVADEGKVVWPDAADGNENCETYEAISVATSVDRGPAAREVLVDSAGSPVDNSDKSGDEEESFASPSIGLIQPELEVDRSRSLAESAVRLSAGEFAIPPEEVVRTFADDGQEDHGVEWGEFSSEPTVEAALSMAEQQQGSTGTEDGGDLADVAIVQAQAHAAPMPAAADGNHFQETATDAANTKLGEIDVHGEDDFGEFRDFGDFSDAPTPIVAPAALQSVPAGPLLATASQPQAPAVPTDLLDLPLAEFHSAVAALLAGLARPAALSSSQHSASPPSLTSLEAAFPRLQELRKDHELIPAVLGSAGGGKVTQGALAPLRWKGSRSEARFLQRLGLCDVGHAAQSASTTYKAPMTSVLSPGGTAEAAPGPMMPAAAVAAAVAVGAAGIVSQTDPEQQQQLQQPASATIQTYEMPGELGPCDKAAVGQNAVTSVDSAPMEFGDFSVAEFEGQQAARGFATAWTEDGLNAFSSSAPAQGTPAGGTSAAAYAAVDPFAASAAYADSYSTVPSASSVAAEPAAAPNAAIAGMAGQELGDVWDTRAPYMGAEPGVAAGSVYLAAGWESNLYAGEGLPPVSSGWDANSPEEAVAMQPAAANLCVTSAMVGADGHGSSTAASQATGSVVVGAVTSSAVPGGGGSVAPHELMGDGDDWGDFGEAPPAVADIPSGVEQNAVAARSSSSAGKGVFEAGWEELDVGSRGVMGAGQTPLCQVVGKENWHQAAVEAIVAQMPNLSFMLSTESPTQ